MSKIADSFSDIAARLRQINGEPPEEEECPECFGGGWACFATPAGNPCFRECETCFNPKGNPCP